MASEVLQIIGILEIADNAAEDGRWEEAISQYKRVLEIDPRVTLRSNTSTKTPYMEEH